MTVLPTLMSPVLALTPAIVTWTPKVALVMILCNVIAIAIGKATIKHPNVGMDLPNNGEGHLLGEREAVQTPAHRNTPLDH